MRDLTNKEIRKKLDTLEGSIEGLSKDVGKVNKQQTKINKELMSKSQGDWDFDWKPGVTDLLDIALTIGEGIVEGRSGWDIAGDIFLDVTGLSLIVRLVNLLNREDIETQQKIDEIEISQTAMEEFFYDAFENPEKFYGSHIDVSLEGNGGDYDKAEDQAMYLFGYYSGATFEPKMAYDDYMAGYYGKKLTEEKGKLDSMQEGHLPFVGETATEIYNELLEYMNPENDSNVIKTIQLDEGQIIRQKFKEDQIEAFESDKEGIISQIEEGILNSLDKEDFANSYIWDQIEEEYGIDIETFELFALRDSYAYQYAQTYYIGATEDQLLELAAMGSAFGLENMTSQRLIDLWDDWDLQNELVSKLNDYVQQYTTDKTEQIYQRDSMEWVPDVLTSYKNGVVDNSMVDAAIKLLDSVDMPTTKNWYWRNRLSGGNPPSYGHMALGSQYAPGGFMEVGEHGPEIAYIPEGAKVFTNSYSKQLAQEAMRWIKGEHEKNQLENVENQKSKPLMREDLDEIADYVIEKLVRELEATIFNMP